MARSISTPLLSSTSTNRQASICSRTRAGGYHLKGRLMISASCPARLISRARLSASISAPPRTKGTCTVSSPTRISSLPRDQGVVLRPIEQAVEPFAEGFVLRLEGHVHGMQRPRVRAREAARFRDHHRHFLRHRIAVGGV